MCCEKMYTGVTDRRKKESRKLNNNELDVHSCLLGYTAV
jgi:hypothetical protein